jgi:hypothetical protein
MKKLIFGSTVSPGVDFKPVRKNGGIGRQEIAAGATCEEARG